MSDYIILERIYETYRFASVQANMTASKEEGLSDDELLGQMTYVPSFQCSSLPLRYSCRNIL